MSRRPSNNLVNDSVGVFASNVHDLAKHLRTNDGSPYLGDINDDVSKCANGLTFLSRLLEEYMKLNTRTETYASIGLTDAMEILDFLKTGHAHPIAKYIDGLRSAEFRKHIGDPEKGPPKKTELEEIKLSSVVGAVLALQLKHEYKRDRAIKFLLELTSKLEYGFTRDKIIGWQNYLEDKSSIGPEAFKNHLLQLSDKKGESLDKVIVDCLRTSWDVAIPG